jgi:hypothetical protein
MFGNLNGLKMFFQMLPKKNRSVGSSSLKLKGSRAYAYVLKFYFSQLNFQNLFSSHQLKFSCRGLNCLLNFCITVQKKIPS